MSFVVSPYLPFAPLSWWMSLAGCDELLLDRGEHFQKMSYRNRYRIAGANGPLLLSVPLAGGRDQRISMGALLIDYASGWQAQHWRSFSSAYGRAPFFEHYSHGIRELLHTRYELLVDFNLATIRWVLAALRLPVRIGQTDTYMAAYPDAAADLRRAASGTTPPFREVYYAQVFEHRHGYLPDLSILDLLMNEGLPGWQWLLKEAG
jgi:hypothetical protein